MVKSAAISIALIVPCSLSASLISPLPTGSEVEITVSPVEGDATRMIQAAIDSASANGGEVVRIRFTPGNYHISRRESTPVLYHISNTSSAEENPDQTKHVGLWMRGMRNITLEGYGAKIVTHGEMTPLVIDECENVTLTGFTLTAADPTVPEIRILAVDDKGFTALVTAPSEFVVEDGRFYWKGEGWSFGHEPDRAVLPEHALVFYPEKTVTRRVASPLRGRRSACKIDDRTVRFEFDKVPEVREGEIYQLRHGIRNEACGVINRSRNVTLSDMEFNFMGNFGLVGQYSENITYDNIRCRPALLGGRTDAGFADFVQMSGCKGLIKIVNSHFEGAHDDPINIHGTHLKIVSVGGRNTMGGKNGIEDESNVIRVRFMHGQTYGFPAFFIGDSVEIVDSRSLLSVKAAEVVEAVMEDDYVMRLRLSCPLPDEVVENCEEYVVENITWTPDVEIRGNYFARTPTRAILLTTRRRSVIENNLFFRIPMASILVSDDARSWFESGPVRDLTIRRNTFMECSSPVIAITPEVERYDGPVHSNILIEENRFIMTDPAESVLKVDASSDVIFRDNVIESSDMTGR